jgi:hypothetical protein
MRQLRAGAWLVAVLALACSATACGTRVDQGTGGGNASAPRSSPSTIAEGSAAATRSAAAKEAEADKEKAIAASGKAGTTPSSSAGAKSKRADLVNGVSCAGGGCVAVGGYYSSAAAPDEYPLAEEWDGQAWTMETVPSGPRYSYLTDVSCAAPAGDAAAGPAGCLAVGDFVLAKSGGQWRTVSPDSDLVAVSCSAPDSCMAVGTHSAPQVPVFAVWNGTTLTGGTIQPPPHSYQGVEISGVSCVSASDCVAVGSYSYGGLATGGPAPGARTRTLAEQWNGRGWQLLPTVDVSANDYLTAVSCVSAVDCTAVGANQSQYPIAEQWNGSAWTAVSMPTVSIIGFMSLTGISCPAADACVAAGTYQGEPAAERWNGSAWRLTLLPQPPVDNHSSQLTGISCVSASECVAVGWDALADGYTELYTDGGWQLMGMVNPL